MDDGFSLMVSVSADEWARLNMRARYLEAALVQAYRNERQLREWFGVSDLLSMELPGLPMTRQGLLKKAQSEHWLARTGQGRGGERHEFHFSALPRRAFAELIRRIVAPEETPQRPSVPQPRPLPANAEPPWLLPLMRLLRRDKHLTPEAAWRLLPTTLPPTVPPPSQGEVETAVLRLRHNGP